MLSTRRRDLGGVDVGDHLLDVAEGLVEPGREALESVAMVLAWAMTLWMFSEASAARCMKSLVEVMMPSDLFRIDRGHDLVGLGDDAVEPRGKAAGGVGQLGHAREEVLDALGVVGERAGEGLDVLGRVGDRLLVVGEEAVDPVDDRSSLLTADPAAASTSLKADWEPTILGGGIGEDAGRRGGAAGHVDIGDAGQEIRPDLGLGVGLDRRVLTHFGRHQHLVRDRRDRRSRPVTLPTLMPAK